MKLNVTNLRLFRWIVGRFKVVVVRWSFRRQKNRVVLVEGKKLGYPFIPHKESVKWLG